MTKRILIKWLEDKQSEALHNAKMQYDMAEQAYLEKRNTVMQISETAEQIHSLVSKADDILDDWLDSILKIDGIIQRDSYRCLKDLFSDMSTVHNVEEKLKLQFRDNTKKYQELYKKNELIIDEIKRNYANVITNVQQLKDAKTGIKYLEELGFDLTDLLEADAQPVTTALSVPINKKYLFISNVNSERTND